jgi:peptide subunit release factor RF-3
LDPKHRDRIAFVPICSGKFERDMTVVHPRSGKTLRLSSSQKLFGQERETVNEAWPGDVADKFDQPVALFTNDWTMRYFVEKNPS